MEMVEDSMQIVIGDSENKDCHMEKKTLQGGLEESKPVENGHDEYDGMDRHGKCLNPDNAFQHNQHEIAHNANKIPQDISGDGLHLDNSEHSGQLKPSNSFCHLDATVRTNHISNGEKVGEEMVRENSFGTGLDINQHEVSVDPNDSDFDQSSYPVMPQLRRKKVPWTVQEEEMLKLLVSCKGVQKFSSDGKFPWKDILEYGSSVFLSGRTTIDLKDKWRNMYKVISLKFK
ncbi:hypothetical protein NC651_015263 [Populus alba x Populus x berolinensis]|nr:hypothetical protein NC651_015263 [Populus alba x Populus x berolinensis]